MTGGASGALTPSEVETSFLDACRAEINALKPGNVHVYADGHGMEVHHFVESAKAAAPFIADRRLKVGERVLGAVAASVAAAGCNTNLGIVLLCAPLAVAAETADASQTLRDRLAAVLAELDHRDAEEVFAAIRTANPGGLSRVSKGDVMLPPTISLLDAMGLAAERDRIAKAYITGFEEIFDDALPVLRQAAERAPVPDLAITTLHMHLLAAAPDSHVARKFGSEVAAGVQQEAAALRAAWHPVTTARSFNRLIAFDTALKVRGLNPGTTADLVVACLFADALERRLAVSRATQPTCPKS